MQLMIRQLFLLIGGFERGSITADNESNRQEMLAASKTDRCRMESPSKIGVHWTYRAIRKQRKIPPIFPLQNLRRLGKCLGMIDVEAIDVIQSVRSQRKAKCEAPAVPANYLSPATYLTLQSKLRKIPAKIPSNN
jgi:hypothetical protein